MPLVPVSRLSASPASNQSGRSFLCVVALLVASLLSRHLIAFAARSPFHRIRGRAAFLYGRRGGGCFPIVRPVVCVGRLLLAVVGGRRRACRIRYILFPYLLIGFLYFI